MSNPLLDLAVKTATRRAEQMAAREAEALAVKRAEQMAAKRAAPAVVRSAGGSAARAAKGAGYSPAEMAGRYPETVPGVPAIDKKTGKPFIEKQQSPEALAVGKARKQAQSEIKSGDYTPYFDASQRTYADPSNYPLEGRTLTDALPAKQDTIERYRVRANDPGALGRLSEAYTRMEGNPNAEDWYAMGQLEKAYIDKLGPEAGREAFKQHFAVPMAATTGGADPTSNYLMSQYGGFMRRQGLPVPTASADVPYPVGGRFASNNLRMYNRVLHDTPLSVDNPKRFNFAANFMGHREPATIDEQMSNLFEPGLQQPPGDSYGVYEQALSDLAAKRGVPASNFQDVAWAGGKNMKDASFKGMPMIDVINHAIHRTSRVTGLDPDVVVEGMVSGSLPTYADGGLVEAPDYDYAGAKRAGVKPDVRGHMPDTYKLPNHMTFSDDSIYSQPGHEGGKWRQTPDGSWVFWASPLNASQHSLPEMSSYFHRVEQGHPGTPDSFAVYPSDYRLPAQ